MASNDSSVCHQKGQKLVEALYLKQQEKKHGKGMCHNNVIDDADTCLVKIAVQIQVHDSNGK